MRVCPLGSMVSEPSLIAGPIDFTQTVLGTQRQEFCLLCILLEAVCRHPVIDICDTVFKFPNSSRCIIATTTLIQLRIVGKRDS